MYSSIHLNTDTLKCYNVVGPKKDEISNLSKINIFIGPNNSGKSRFLREVFSSKNIEFKDDKINLKEINSCLTEIKKGINKLIEINQIKGINGVDPNFFEPIDYLRQDTSLKEKTYDIILKLSEMSVSGVETTFGRTPDFNYLNYEINSLAKPFLNKLKNLKDFNNNYLKRENLYIPTLRGLRGIDYDDNKSLRGWDNYLRRTKNDYFKNDQIESFIFSGLGLYDLVKNQLLGSFSERKKIRNFEVFISNTFFNNKEFSIVPRIDDNVVHIKIGNENEFPIHELGDGIQSIIILTYPLFINQGKPLNIFFEEPDMFLHPGFQRIFIETLQREEFKDFQFFFTTHSNHFLDMTLDYSNISVYSFKKKEEKMFEIENVENKNRNLLKLLGVRNSSVFLTNCTIWVEGITDRIYLRKHLELYQKKHAGHLFQEDIHYSFVEYGGNNITHWSFLDEEEGIDVERLCGNLFLIADKDGNGLTQTGEKSKKEKRHEQLLEVLGEDHYYRLQSKEIENLLSPNILKNVICTLENKRTGDLDLSKIKLSSYKSKSLGKFIEENVEGLKKNYAAESGTIKDKVNFARSAVSQMESLDELSEEAKTLTKKLYEFIKNNN